MGDAVVPLLLALGDDELILGHRHSEWTGWAPHIEEDVAFSSIAQDEIGHAAAFYALAGKIVGKSADELAFGREPSEYRNALFCERPNGDWAYTLARHWLYDHADDLRLEALEGSSNADIASLATKMRREERYHLIHADMWVKKIANGPVEGRAKLAESLGEAYPDAIALFEAVELEDEALAQGLSTASSADLGRRFIERTTKSLDELGFPTHTVPNVGAEFVASSSGDLIEEGAGSDETSERESNGGRAGSHTKDFEELWSIMTTHFRESPGATW